MSVTFRNETWCPEEFHKDCLYKVSCQRVLNEYVRRMAEREKSIVSAFKEMPNCHSVNDEKETTVCL